MLSTLEPKLINTTQKSVESKQGICSSKPNAQQKLHAQKTFEIQKKFHEFILIHNTFNPSQTRSDRKLQLHILFHHHKLSTLFLSFLSKIWYREPRKHSAYEKRGYTAEAEACDARESGRLTCVDSICRARSLAIGTSVYKMRRVVCNAELAAEGARRSSPFVP